MGLRYIDLYAKIRLMNYEKTKAKLQQLKGRWPDLAKSCGVPYGTLKKIADGTVRNPTIDTLSKIDDGLRMFR